VLLYLGLGNSGEEGGGGKGGQQFSMGYREKMFKRKLNKGKGEGRESNIKMHS